MRRSIIAIVLGAVLLSGCASYEIAKEAARAAGERAADEALRYAIFVKCKASTVGAIQRYYAGRMRLWEQECGPLHEDIPALEYKPDGS